MYEGGVLSTRTTAVELGLSVVAVTTKHRSFRGQGGVGWEEGEGGKREAEVCAGDREEEDDKRGHTLNLTQDRWDVRLTLLIVAQLWEELFGHD
jgi:hypothetical protein